MQFRSFAVSGHGRGKALGFPTINLEVKGDFALSLTDGIYAAWAWIKEEKYPAALYFGPVPVFGDKEKSLELYLLDTIGIYVGNGDMVAFEPVAFIREVMNFSSPELLISQMEKDVVAVRKALHIE